MTDKEMTDSEIYDYMTNYQSPDFFLSGLENWSELPTHVRNYVFDMKHEMLPATSLTCQQIVDAMIRYLNEQREIGELEDFPPLQPSYLSKDDGEMVLWFIERLKKRIWRNMVYQFQVSNYWVDGIININYQEKGKKIEFTFICKFYYPHEFHVSELNREHSVFYNNVDTEFYFYLDKKFPFLNIYAPQSGYWDKSNWYGYDKENDEVIMKFYAECEIK
jgi:hypothetical protein